MYIATLGVISLVKTENPNFILAKKSQFNVSHEHMVDINELDTELAWGNLTGKE